MLYILPFLVLLGLGLTYGAIDIPLQDCGSPLATLTSLYIDPPCGPDSCVIKRGERFTLQAQFIPKLGTKSMSVIGYSKDLVFGYETYLWRDNFCSGRFNVSCPMEAGETQYAYISEVVPTNMVPAKFRIKIILAGESDNQKFICKSHIVEFK